MDEAGGIQDKSRPSPSRRTWWCAGRVPATYIGVMSVRASKAEDPAECCLRRKDRGPLRFLPTRRDRIEASSRFPWLS